MSEHLDPPSMMEGWAALKVLELGGTDMHATRRWALGVLHDLIGEYGALQEAKAMLVIQIEDMERDMPDD